MNNYENPTYSDRLKNVAKTSGKVAYNSTIGEIKNARIPVIDTAYRYIYNKVQGNEKPVFNEDLGYKPLGGLRRKNNRTNRRKKNRTKRRK